MNTNGVQDIVFSALSTSPLAMVLFWMVWNSNKKIDQKDEQIEKMNEKLGELMEHNTVALGTIAQKVGEQNEITKTLNDRILAVLTRYNDK